MVFLIRSITVRNCGRMIFTEFPRRIGLYPASMTAIAVVLATPKRNNLSRRIRIAIGKLLKLNERFIGFEEQYLSLSIGRNCGRIFCTRFRGNAGYPCGACPNTPVGGTPKKTWTSGWDGECAPSARRPLLIARCFVLTPRDRKPNKEIINFKWAKNFFGEQRRQIAAMNFFSGRTAAVKFNFVAVTRPEISAGHWRPHLRPCGRQKANIRPQLRPSKRKGNLIKKHIPRGKANRKKDFRIVTVTNNERNCGRTMGPESHKKREKGR